MKPPSFGEWMVYELQQGHHPFTAAMRWTMIRYAMWLDRHLFHILDTLDR